MAMVNTGATDIEATAATTDVARNTGVRRHRRRRRRRRPRTSVAASSETTTEGSFRFSDTEDGNRSLHSQVGESYDECRSSTETEGISVISGSRRCTTRRGSCAFTENDEEKEADLESGELELKVRTREQKRQCRICHLSLSIMGNQNGADHSFMELGCGCKGDLGSAHKQCAETWFKIKGNTTCEICGASAANIAGEPVNEANSATGVAAPASTAPSLFYETRSFWHGRRVMNFLLACMIFAFVVSWLFHFKRLP